jgi:tetratricopeptide (TPR) repeat protein
MAKAKKKSRSMPVLQQDNTQAQQMLERYHQVANSLRSSTDQKQAEAALAEINNMPEGAQIALLKALSKEHHTDAADILIAMNELSSTKSIRKEARRALIHLEEARIYPRWRSPVVLTPAVQAATSPLRFWKGVVTDSLDIGEVELVLCFEVKENPRQVRVLTFLLEFWHDGVKDFFTRIEGKRNVEELIAEMSARLNDVKTKECSLVQGRRLLLDALAVNKRHGTLPHRDYRSNVSLVNQLVLEAPGLEEEGGEEAELEEKDKEKRINIHGLKPAEVVINFVESWADGDYDRAYDLLSDDSPIREGLTRDEWIERREDWSEKADPYRLEPDYIHEREPQETKLWLPRLFSAQRSTLRKEIEAGWSIELGEIPDIVLPEFSQASAIYEETKRHWFWASYTLLQEEGEWRIQSMTDEVANAQLLSIEELQKRIQEHEDSLNEFTTQHKPTGLDEKEAVQYLDSILWRVMQMSYYTDALIKKLPLDLSLYQDAAGIMLLLRKYERCAVYLEPLARHFVEQRGLNLRELAAVQRELSKRYFDEGDDERAERFQELAEGALHESLAVEDSLEAHISIAELLIDENERLDEAEDHLLQARALTTDPSDEAHIELHLAEIAVEREKYEEALGHYQHVADIQPDDAQSWFDIAETHRLLKNYEEAEANYKHAIELEPNNEDYYYMLSQMYSESNQTSKAIEAIEDGLSNDPDSSLLNMYLALMYFESGDYRQAEIFLDKAERIDPEAPFVQAMRQILNLNKLSKTPRVPNIPKLSKPDKKKRR